MTQKPFPFEIRPMEQGDISTVTAIDQLSFPTPWSASSYSYEMRYNTASFYYVLVKPAIDGPAPRLRPWHQFFKNTATHQDQVIGYVGYRLHGPRAHISTIAVHPDWRGHGFGELLLLRVLEEAMEKERSTITLEVRASNHIAQHLYRKCGFRFTGVQQQYYRDGEDAWLMEVNTENRTYQARVADLRSALEARLIQQTHPTTPAVGQNGLDGI
jgi:ribosomal-protein-alanine N-acetyltransferase